jgi:hypothetical protein
MANRTSGDYSARVPLRLYVPCTARQSSRTNRPKACLLGPVCRKMARFPSFRFLRKPEPCFSLGQTSNRVHHRGTSMPPLLPCQPGPDCGAPSDTQRLTRLPTDLERALRDHHTGSDGRLTRAPALVKQKYRPPQHNACNRQAVASQRYVPEPLHLCRGSGKTAPAYRGDERPDGLRPSQTPMPPAPYQRSNAKRLRKVRANSP